MRLIALVAGVAVSTAVFSATRGEDELRGPPGALTLVGDSLNVGTEPYLRDELAGWHIDAHDRVGRTTAEGVEVLRDRRDDLASIVVVSLGTNDPGGTEQRFRALVEEAIEIVGPGRCLLWATIVRDGVARESFNRVLQQARSEHPNVRLVDWVELVSGDAALIGADGVHGTPDGYARRGAETARAVRACQPENAA